MKLKSSKSYLTFKHGKEYSEEISKKKAQSLPNFIKRYGELEGVKKWEIYKKSIVLRKEDFIKKYGEDQWEKLSQKRTFKKSLEYHIEIYGLEAGTKKYLDLISSYSFTKEDYIKKYGIEKWKDRSIKLNKFKGYSKESCRFFEILIERIKENNIEIQSIKWKDEEFFLWDKEYRRIYFYDFYFEINGNRFIIEYDNSYWHPKNEFKTNFINSGLVSNMSIQEKVEYDDRKFHWAKYNGIEIISVYFDSPKNPLKSPHVWEPFLNSCVEKIKSNAK